ncbi:MAG: Ppx/GppA family phosphatase [Deferribacteraceae bacterium]|jgi:exopolyphosphatase/guanosine-5'-triphosphate,3'-diphosphate pyrophosphatase|nr:Ppx/GppA family phosphatase [Deferribacteraceae bacterium]
MNLIVAVIDMGSNSFRLQVSEVKEGVYNVIEDYKETVRIGDGVYNIGKFSPEAIETIINVLKRMKIIMEKMKVSKWRIVGTAPFRDAENADEAISAVKAALDFDIDVISGTEEARLTYLAATGSFDLKGLSTLFVDVGGGSTELSFVTDGNLDATYSTPLGCSRITQQYFGKHRAKPDEVSKLEKYIKRALKSAIANPHLDKIVFTGGTVNNLAQVFTRRSSLSDSVVKYVDTAFFTHLVNELAGKSYEERGKMPGIEAARADISLAAALIVQNLLNKYKMDGFYTFSGGLRNGITIDLLNSMGIQMVFQHIDNQNLRYAKLKETGRKYNYEEVHALHVTALSERIFLQAHKALHLKESDWPLLEAAAILHDVGQHIGYAKHHKHSYYLINNTELVGYTDREREVIANIARYHRRGLPKVKQTNFGALSDDERDKVCKLSAILRVADGLDRSHSQLVQDIEVIIRKDGIYIEVVADSQIDVTMELAGLEKKKDLLEEVFNKKIICGTRL